MYLISPTCVSVSGANDAQEAGPASGCSLRDHGGERLLLLQPPSHGEDGEEEETPAAGVHPQTPLQGPVQGHHGEGTGIDGSLLFLMSPQRGTEHIVDFSLLINTDFIRN